MRCRRPGAARPRLRHSANRRAGNGSLGEAAVGRCGGPGLVTRALGIDGALNGVPLRPPGLYVVDDQAPRGRVYVTPRIGVQGTGRWERRLLRYCVDSPYLSRPIPKRLRPAAGRRVAPR
ncbi:MAG: hypothetical protein E6I71_00290 [Chloroflexi bacterium]|nr:MAG: hypothetical protein E6I71_00290 [Chloroflexota bacterium]